MENTTPKLRKENVQTSNKVGKELISWTFPEFDKHNRGPFWYLGAGLLSLGLLVYCYFEKNALFAIMILLVLFIIFINHKREALHVRIVLTTTGILIGSDFYLYREIESFAVLYDPPVVKRLYLAPKNRTLIQEISIPLEKQNPIELRSLLLDYVPEDIERENEATHEAVGRMLKF